MYESAKFLVFFNAKKKKIPLNMNSSLKASKNKGILHVRNGGKKIDPVSENIIALVIDVISRIPKPKGRLNFNPFMVIPKSLNLYFLNFMTTSPGKTNKIVFARK